MTNPPVQLPQSAETQLHSSLKICPEIWLGYEFQNGLKMALRLKNVREEHLKGISEQFRLLAEAYDRFAHEVMVRK